MDDHQSVKIIEICKVTPSPPWNSPAPNSLPLTFFDLLWLRFHPIQRLFFYQLSPSFNNDISFPDAILSNLKTSLALALHYYLPLAGNLLWPQHTDIPTVEVVEGDGVSLTVAESDADFDHLSGNGFREVEEYHPLVPRLPASDDRAAVIALQLTLFGKRGFSIGISSHHAVLDGRTSTSFLKLWARLCHRDVVGGSSLSTAELMPFYNRSVIEDSPGLAAIYANTWLNAEGPNNRSLNLKLPKTPPGLTRCTFEFTRQNLQNLKQRIWNEQEKKNQQKSHISSFVLATAYFCVCTAKSQSLRAGKLGFAFAADARSRLKPPVPSNYFGNCLSGCGISMERSELLSENNYNGIVVASEAISKAIKRLEEGALNGVENWCSIMVASTIGNNKFEAKSISIAGSPRFDVYSADFGWGKPRKVEVVSAQSSLTISLTDSTNGDGGIEIGVVKEKDEMEKFAALFAKGLECVGNEQLHI